MSPVQFILALAIGLVTGVFVWALAKDDHPVVALIIALLGISVSVFVNVEVLS
jgi:xanthosine utilization system XapX-like protein